MVPKAPTTSTTAAAAVAAASITSTTRLQHKFNLQSIVASILVLFSLNFYLNIADSRSVRYAVVPQQQDSHGAIIKEAISIPAAPSITLGKKGEFTAPARVYGRGGQRNSKNGNPTLVLHMGPTKTGSTFTQCVLTSMGETLALDNYTYLGMGIKPCVPEEEEPTRHHLIQHCYNSMFIYNGLATLAPEVVSVLHWARLQKKNAIFVNECFQFYTPDQIKVLAAELRPWWNIKIIMSYRRIYEFLPSSYNQNLKPKAHVPEFGLWPGERARIGPRTDDTGKRKMVVGRELAPFDIDDRDGFTKQFRRMENEGVHPVEEVRRLYRHFWPDITIIKLHELNRSGSGDAGLQKMFCDILDMHHSCEAAKLDSTIEVADRYSNTYFDLGYELLASEAFRQELFGFQQEEDGRKMKRKSAVIKIRDHQEDDLNLTISDFPQECLPRHKMDRIINASLLVERTLFPKNCTEEVEANHIRAFDEYNKKKNRYCSIDVIETLKNAEWRAFLASF